MEFKCPTCRHLLYSRRPKICGNCGASLPPEMLLSDEDVRLREEERQRARDLADGFSDALSGKEGSKRTHTAGKPDVSSVSGFEKAPADYSEEFKRRKRIGFPIMLLAVALTITPLLYVLLTAPKVSPLAVALVIGFAGLFCCAAWWKVAPICPKCHQNIRTCPMVFCHRCGGGLRGGRCASCSVDHSWTGVLNPYGSGRMSRIEHCPSCSAYLNSFVSRWPH